MAEAAGERHRAWVGWGYYFFLQHPPPPRVSCVRMASVRSRLVGEIMQVGSQDKTQAGVSPRAPSVPPAAASVGRRALKLAVEGGCGGHRQEKGGSGGGGKDPTAPGVGCGASPDGVGLCGRDGQLMSPVSAPETKTGEMLLR